MLQNAGAVSLALTLLAATPALAVGPGLPRTYTVQKVDSPLPALTGAFGSGMASAGDLNGDGKDDLLLFSLLRSPNEDGQVFVLSGATGSLIDTIVAPDPGGAGNKANFAFPWMSKVGTNRSSAPFTDLASCPGGTSGALCPTPAIAGADGVPDILVGARGVDARGLTDAGRVYVFDGKTRALLKRIDQPAADTTPVALSRAGGTWFGRSVLNPAGTAGCEGNSSVGPCPTAIPRAVQIGDMDGGGQPDLVIGASATSENQASAYPTSHCARTAGAICLGSGRVYMYRGEEIVGSSPNEILDGTTNGNTPSGSNGTETFKRIRNIASQADDLQSSVSADSEIFGNSLTPVGDVGSCDLTKAPVGTGSGDRCPRAAGSTAPDGKPDFLIGALRVDLPIDNPQTALADAGASFLADGATGTILTIYEHPEPQSGAVFGSQFTQPATGDLGDSTAPDVFIPAAGQNTTVSRGGRGYVMNGNFKASITSLNFSTLNDPTPHAVENFGYASVGVGDLVGGTANPANEVLTGSEGPFFGSAPRENILNDVHFFNGFTGRVLQTIPDPDQQGGGSFGATIAGLGDLNGDGFLDFAVGAENFTGTTGVAEGRLYMFRSDNSPPAPGPSSPVGPPAGPSEPVPGPTPVATPAGATPARCTGLRVLKPNISRRLTQTDSRVRSFCAGKLTASASTKVRVKGKSRTLRLRTQIKAVGGRDASIKVGLGSKKVRRELRRSGRVTVRLVVRFTPAKRSAYALPSARTIRIVVRRK